MGWFCILWRHPNMRKKLILTGGFKENAKISKNLHENSSEDLFTWNQENFYKLHNFFTYLNLYQAGLEACRWTVDPLIGSTRFAANKSFFWTFFCILGVLGVSRTPGVRVFPKIGIFTAPCGTHGTSLFKFSIKSCLGWGIWGPADTSGSWSNHLLYTFLYNKKNWPVQI